MLALFSGQAQAQEADLGRVQCAEIRDYYVFAGAQDAMISREEEIRESSATQDLDDQ